VQAALKFALLPKAITHLPRKIRELVIDLYDAGFTLVPGGGKGSHRKFTHVRSRAL
jgi:hypothetical protein